ncbi:MAG: LysR family transcriptional regulator, partial [Limosilactobacillus mucosae]
MTVNLELLTELVAFKRYGTLSATAEHLMITQPTVTRGMKRLEEELGVTLFDRSVSNHIKLNDTGLLAANEAAKLLKNVDDFTDKVLNYDRLRNEFTVASIIP